MALHIGDRGRCDGDNNLIDKFQVLLGFILENGLAEERPYLTGDVLGRPILGLLDSGVSRTILGNKGFWVIRELGLPLDKSKSN